MIMIKKIPSLSLLTLIAISNVALALPKGFVYLRDIAPDIIQDIRYAGYHNFIGRPIHGYQTNECILTTQAARALINVQNELKRSKLSLKVYDCYRPQMAVNDFITWSKIRNNHLMKEEFYPQLTKPQLFSLGYVAMRSGHTRGSTVDLTIVPLQPLQQEIYHQGQKLIPCYAEYLQRYADNSIDMGTGFDCMSARSHPNSKNVSIVAKQNRMLLQGVMRQYGFYPYSKEWWHFTLKNEPYRNKYFNFKIEPLKS